MIPTQYLANKSPYDLLDYHPHRTPDKTALANLDAAYQVTYSELVQRIKRLAAGLKAQGVASGDRVAVLAYNDARVFETLYACAYIGAVMVPMNWRLKTGEIAALLEDCKPGLIVHDDANTGLVKDAVAGDPTIKTLMWSAY